MQVYLGIDWSEQKHDVVFQDERGRHLLQLIIPHNLAGFLKLDNARQQLGIEPQEVVVGMETAHNLLIDFLWERGYVHVYVLPPSQVNSNRGRLRQSGAWDDPQDAGLIAEIVRTDHHRLYPWQPGSPLLQQMRAKLRLVAFLTKEVVQYSNRLRSVLLRYYPGALNVFSGLNTQITLAFLQAYPNPQTAEQLTYPAFCEFASQHGYPQPKKLPACFARLQKAQPPPAAATLAAYQQEALLLAGLLSQLLQAKGRELRQLRKLYEQHPDRPIFDSLPQAGGLIESGLLVKLGEDRQRFPQASLVQALAGTCPVTQKSGRSRRVTFRQACDREFRYIVQEWARLTVNASPWATDYYQKIRPHCRSDNHAYRCLANRWLSIVWKLWHDHIPYDETYHLKRRAARQLPRPSALVNP
jgi:transposase